MPLYPGTIPPEMLRLAMDTTRRLTEAQQHISERNYGLANSAIEQALGLLPWDTGVHIVWPALEDRTS